MNPSLRRDALFALGLGLLALIVRLLFLAQSPLNGLYGQDAYAYFAHAQAIRGTLASGATLPAFFWPVGYPALLATAFSVFGESAAAGQALSLLMGAALAPLVYGLARAAGVRAPGALLAGLLMAANGQAIQSSLVLMADIPALFWACLSAFALLVGLRSKRPAIVALAGLLLGIAVITRWANLLLVVPFAATFMAGRGHWRTAVWGIAGFALIVAPQLLISAGSPYPVLNHAWVQGWLPLNAFARDFVNVDGTFHYDQVNGWFYAAPALDPYFLAPLALPLVLLGAFVLRGPFRWLFVGWALLSWLFLAGIPYQNVRFGLLLSPPLAVLAGAGFDWLWAKWATRRAWRGALTAGAAFGLAWMLAASLSPITEFLGRQQADQETVRWASARIPAGVTVYANGLTYALRYATGRPVVELYGLAPEAVAADAERGDMVLVNRWQIENQWAGTPMQEALHRLSETHGLTRSRALRVLHALPGESLMHIGYLLPGFSARSDEWAIPVQQRLVRELTKADRVTVIALRYPQHARPYTLMGAHVVPLGGSHTMRGWQRLQLWQKARVTLERLHHETPFDVLHATWADETGLIAARNGRRMGIPSIVSAVGGEFVDLKSLGYGNQRSRFGRWIAQQALTADVLLAASPYLARQMAAVTTRSVQVLPLGVDAQMFSPGGGQMPGRILAVGSTIPVKDHATLLRALARLPSSHLVLIGEGSALPTLATLIAALDLESRVTLLPHIDYTKLPTYYHEAEIHALPSLHEGQGMVTLEAAACATPTVGSAVGLLADDPALGMAVPPGDPVALADALAEWLGNRAARHEAGERARARVLEAYSIEQTAERLRAIYAHAIALKT